MSDLGENPRYVLVPERDDALTADQTPLSPAWDVPLVPADDGRIQVAAFDFDGTCIKGNSPVLLVRYLGVRGMLKKSIVARLILWGGAYKVRLPQTGLWARGAVFTAFEGRPVAEVDRFLATFYHQVVAGRFREAAAAEMREHALAGHAVVLVSASFEPIILEAMHGHYVRYQISTRMAVDDDGCYTREVEGIPCAGGNKVKLLERFCDDTFGVGKWTLGWAYGDHYSDRFLLEKAHHPYTVTPDRALTRFAKKEQWPILDWS